MRKNECTYTCIYIYNNYTKFVYIFFCLHKMLVTIAKQPKVFGHFNYIFHSTYNVYCGIIIVLGGQMFVAFVGNHCPWTYIPTYLYTIIYLIFIKIIPMVHYQRNYVPTNQENFLATLTPRNKNDSTVLVKYNVTINLRERV